jgi:hypothetical protein
VRTAAVIWAVLAFLFALAFQDVAVHRPNVAALFMAAVMAVVSGWLAWRLWRSPSRVSVVIAACVAAFILFLGAVVWLSGRTDLTPVLIPVAVGVAVAGALPLRAWRRLG